MQHRTLREAIIQLARLRDQTTDVKLEIYAQALIYGINTRRTIPLLEQALTKAPDLELMATTLAGLWDGQDCISGALYHANQWAREEAKTADVLEACGECEYAPCDADDPLKADYCPAP